MKHVVWPVAAAVTLASAAWAQTVDPTRAEELEILRAALDVSRKAEGWTFWMMVTGVASAFAATLGVIALVWTFAAQRALVHAQEGPVLNLTDCASKIVGKAIQFQVEIKNIGRSVADNVGGRVTKVFGGAIGGDVKLASKELRTVTIANGETQKLEVFLLDVPDVDKLKGGVFGVTFEISYRDVHKQKKSQTMFTGVYLK